MAAVLWWKADEAQIKADLCRKKAQDQKENYIFMNVACSFWRGLKQTKYYKTKNEQTMLLHCWISLQKKNLKNI